MATLTSNNNFIQPGMKVLVAGLGRTGVSAVKFLLQHDARVSVSDSSPAGTILPEVLAWLETNKIPFETGSHSIDFFTGSDLVFVSPGIPLSIGPITEAKRMSIPVVGELAIAAHYLKTPAVGITGTNGKTTVTTLLGHMFRTAYSDVFVGGNIGTPLLDYISGPQEDKIVVAEISSFQLDSGGNSNGLPFKTAILLNISPDHLDRYSSFSEYAESKFKIFAAQGADDVSILNADDPEIMERKQLWPVSRKYFYGNDLAGFAGAMTQGKKVILTDSRDMTLPEGMHGEVYDLVGTSLANQPNSQNCAAAILAARLAGCSKENIQESISTFKALDHRMTQIAVIDGVIYIDDSKATNVGAVYSALGSTDTPVVLIAGGRDKGGDYSILAEPVRNKVKHLLLIGEARDSMKRAFLAFTRVEEMETLQEAVSRAADLAEPGDTVLLSPACSSFDMFTSYAERGDVFRNAALALGNKKSMTAADTASQ